ncbi:MAG: hypothetical protein AB1772_02945 [Candidatus Zixiibacteriota bacterium]
MFLFLIGSYVLYDYLKHVARKKRANSSQPVHHTGDLTIAQRLHRINIPPMINFKTSGIRCSM